MFSSELKRFAHDHRRPWKRIVTVQQALKNHAELPTLFDEGEAVEGLFGAFTQIQEPSRTMANTGSNLEHVTGLLAGECVTQPS